MSAFIVCDETMQDVVSCIRDLHGGRDFHGVTLGSSLAYDELGNLLFDMNCRAIAARYGRVDADERPAPFQWRPSKTGAGAVQRLKSLECFLYQCSEGDVPDSSLFKAVKELAGDYARRLISETAAYKAASWGRP